MSNPPPAPQLLLPLGLSTAPEKSDSTGTWDDNGTSASDDGEEEACSLPDEGCADEGYWKTRLPQMHGWPDFRAGLLHSIHNSSLSSLDEERS